MNIDINKFSLKKYDEFFSTWPLGRKISRREFSFKKLLREWDSFFHCESFEDDQYHFYIGEKTKTKISYLEFSLNDKKIKNYKLLQELGFPVDDMGLVSEELKENSQNINGEWIYLSDDLDINFVLDEEVLIHCKIYDRKILIKNSPHKTFYKYREIENPEQYLQKIQGVWYCLPEEKEMNYYNNDYFAFIDGREMYPVNMDRIESMNGAFYEDKTLKPDRLKVIDTKKDSFRLAIFSTSYSQSSTEWIKLKSPGEIETKGRNFLVNTRVDFDVTQVRAVGESRKRLMIRDFKTYKVQCSEQAFKDLSKNYPSIDFKNKVFKGFGLSALAVAEELNKLGYESEIDKIPYTLEDVKTSSDKVLRFFAQIMKNEQRVRNYLEDSQIEIQSDYLQRLIDKNPCLIYSNGKILQCISSLKNNKYLTPESH